MLSIRIHKVIEGISTQRKAAEVVSLSQWQVRQIVNRIKAEGDKGIGTALGARNLDIDFQSDMADRGRAMAKGGRPGSGRSESHYYQLY